MSKGKVDLLQGTLDLIVLKLLQAGPASGWELTQSIQVVSGGALGVNYGTLYPALHRLEARGWTSAKWGTTENKRRARFLKEESRDARGVRVVEHLARDIGYAIRLTRKHPAVAGFVVLSLALGLGATTAVFNLTYNVLVAPLALPHPDQLVALVRVDNGGRDVAFSRNEYRALRETPGVGALAAVRTASQMHGRFITADDETRQATLAVLSEPFAERLFPGHPSAVGRTIIIRGTPFTVIGVTPRSFRGLEYPGQFTVAIPLSTVALLAGAGDRGDDRGVPLSLTDDRWGDQRALKIVGRLTTARAAGCRERARAPRGPRHSARDSRQ